MVTIGDLAHKAGVPASKIRYYERVGVLPVPARTGSGYRVYDERDLARLQLLQRGKLLGLSLAELARLRCAADDGCCDVVDPLLDRLLRDKLTEVDHRLAELRALRDTLTGALDRLNRADGADRAQAESGCIDPCATVEVEPPRRYQEMSEVTSDVLPVRDSGEDTEQECCEPECGPDTCGTDAAPVEVAVALGAPAAQCCEPDCGPDTCGC